MHGLQCRNDYIHCVCGKYKRLDDVGSGARSTASCRLRPDAGCTAMDALGGSKFYEAKGTQV